MSAALFHALVAVSLLILSPPGLADPPAGNPPGQVINIWAGTPIGGLGDIASNVIMARHLRELRPGTTINIIVNGEDNALARETRQKLGFLLPSYDPSRPQQTIDGIHFYDSRATLPRADVFFGFSLGGAGGDVLRARATAPVGFLFHEYGEMDVLHRHPPPAWSPLQLADIPVDGSAEIGPNLHARTGVLDAGLGLYVRPDAPRRALDDTQLAAELNRVRPTSTEPVAIGASTRLGFCYTSEEGPSQNYLRAMASVASQPENRSSNFLIVSAFPPPEGLVLPGNMRILVQPRLPFALTEQIIARADLPIMITGDVSLTLAVQYAVPFFYESLGHKYRHVEALRRWLGGRLPAHLSDDFLDQIIPRPMRDHDPAAMARLAGDRRSLQALRGVLETMRREQSMPDLLARVLASVDLRSLPRGNAAERWLAALHVARQTDNPEHIRRAFENPTLLPGQDCLSALGTVKNAR